ncbi:hypothetical protein LZC95_23640 [Pendulispora brunnea]|uniref:Carboxypeptidase regulatory-like domain-containing protein n=1 Tax=Pendulispora brunnea TaxID=2905690 RepID=A0ABZ2KMA1_9BACT
MASMACKTIRCGAALGVGALAFSLAFVGCSSDDTSTPTVDAGNKDTGTGTDAGPGVDSGQPGPGMVTQKGVISDFPPGGGQAVVGATIDVGNGRTATTGNSPKGGYSIQVPKDTPYFMRIRKEGYTTLIEQEWQLTGDADRGKSIFPDKQATTLLVGVIQGNPSFPKVDPAKGVLAIGLIKGSCPTEGGATIRVEPGASALLADDGGTDSGTDAGSDGGSGDAPQVVYLNNRAFPDVAATKSQDGATTPTAIIYNVPPGNRFKITVEHPNCDVQPFPFNEPTAPNIKYTGNIVVEPLGNPAEDGGTNTSTFARILLSKKP